MASSLRRSIAPTSSRPRRRHPGRPVTTPRDEAMALEDHATELRVGLDVLRRQLAAAIRDSGRRYAELLALDTPARQRTRLLVLAAIVTAALVAMTLCLVGGTP